MPPKQRRKSSIASPEQPAKRQKTSASSISNETYDFYQTTLKLVKELRDGKDYISFDFLKLPAKKLFPDYYESIQHPISIEEISNKIKNHQYDSTGQFLKDFELMAENANEYNEQDSGIAKDSLKILDFVKDQVKQFDQINEGDNTTSTPKLPKLKIKAPSIQSTPSTPANGHISPKRKYLEILDDLINYKVDGINIGEPFWEEVSRKDYPDYYALIKKAMSLNTVKRHVKGNKIKDLNQFIEEVELIWSNAQLYNEEGSLIYEDSKTLQKIFQEKIDDWKKYQDELKSSSGSSKKKPTIVKLKNNKPSIKSKLKISLKKEDDDEEQQINDDEQPKFDEEPNDEANKDGLNDDPTEEEEDLPETFKDGNKTQDNEEKIENPEQSTPTPQIVKPTRKRSIKQTAADALIQEISISSSRSIYKSTIKNQLSSINQLPNLYQNWFEYRFEANDFQIKSYTLSLPSQQGAVSVLASLNDSLIDRKHQANLTVNGERVNPIPSIQYMDQGRQISSKYELKLATGLNHVVFDVIVDPIINEESRLRSQDSDPIVEKLIFWVQVVQ
ncbi:Chromatin structure-remodeling complex subunit [Wickerhamomyces ciferrii]|uniref:Chromatin structure-remodeling complex subunit n=1 Tax=Wickerhamomyces ciferrii (strain ATCC 14091 / BCRC 22168 / CBS 111 / JCM 3599 / NBRC 0793 / NRRL Y-1031 F-60-10) TaxID=1206466 RepID=K0KL87_WICCF|nr:Chromatin structure-remodeling complex subunit [Wickerhamomyces ciferrii]CCH46010.1 Chromatin structure-remodeling complex subunit [Wickerhamomyces ciferrii]